jgi:hypothetical protein
MRVLLDENLPHALRRHLSHHETITAAYAGLAGYPNGALLKAAAEAGFDVLVTGDKTLQYEQKLAGRGIAIVLLSANSWRVIEPHASLLVAAIDTVTPGSFTRVDCGTFVRRRSPAP